MSPAPSAVAIRRTPLLQQRGRQPRALMDGALAVGEPVVVLPVLFHLLWSHELTVDVSVPLHADALVSPGDPR